MKVLGEFYVKGPDRVCITVYVSCVLSVQNKGGCKLVGYNLAHLRTGAVYAVAVVPQSR